MAGTTEVKVPDIGESKDVPVIEILVKPGDRVEKEQPLLVLESEKATMEVPSPAAGTVRALKVKLGDKLSQGNLILTLEETGSEKPKPAPHPGPLPQGERGKVVVASPLEGEAARSAGEGGPVSEEPEKLPGKLPVTVPDIGNYSGVPVIEVLVKDGDRVEKDASLLTLESEKAAMDVPAPAAGVVRNLRVKTGDKVSQGDAICELEIMGDGKPKAPPHPNPLSAAQASMPLAALPPSLTDAGEREKPALASPFAGEAARSAGEGGLAAPGIPPWTAQASQPIPHASPLIRKLAREFGVDLQQVKGTGPKGRITQDDVRVFVKSRLSTNTESRVPGPGAGIPPVPSQDFSQFGEIETKPLARIRKLSAAHLHRAWLNVPHVTQFEEADITELESFRKSQSEESGTKLTLLPFIMKAVSVALKAHPEFNASLAADGENLILKKYCHIGFAADTPNGLVVPVVRDVWSKGIVQLATECGELAKKARDGKLKPEEMKGGCFSISSLGGLGVTGGFTPIVNAPEVAILGVSRATMKPVWDGKVFAPRLMLPLSLSYDHRVIDGAYAARFTVTLARLLADLRRAVL